MVSESKYATTVAARNAFHDEVLTLRAENEILRKRVEKFEAALDSIEKACLCHLEKGFDYGGSHPKLGKCPTGRWLSPKELIDVAKRLRI